MEISFLKGVARGGGARGVDLPGPICSPFPPNIERAFGSGAAPRLSLSTLFKKHLTGASALYPS